MKKISQLQAFHESYLNKLDKVIKNNNLDGYNLLNNSVHELDGFFDIIEPAYNPELERLGDLFFNINNEL